MRTCRSSVMRAVSLWLVVLLCLPGGARGLGFFGLGGPRIRRATVGDLDALAGLRADASPFAVSYKARAKDSAATVAAARANLRGLFCSGIASGSTACFLAVDDKEIVGYCDVTARGPMGRGLGEHAYLKNLRVAPEWRRKGVGERLVREATTYAKTALGHCEYVALEVDDGNAAAERLYARLGFDQIASLSKLSSLFEYSTLCWGRTLMYKRLRPGPAPG